MEKLKTLKDLIDINNEHAMFVPVFTKLLKQEAIKRVKACDDELCCKKYRCPVCKREIWFNNITEEDLK